MQAERVSEKRGGDKRQKEDAASDAEEAPFFLFRAGMAQTMAPGRKKGRIEDLPCSEAPSDAGSGRGKWKEGKYSMP